MTTISIIVCKFVTWVCHLFKRRGTTFPGSVALKFNKHPLDKIKYPKYVVCVTGSSGKGSSVSMIAHILEANGKKVVWNSSGSNVKSAITTLILNNTRCFSRTLDADVLLIEADERFVGSLFKPGIITHLVITNVTRDQPARNIHPKVIYDKIKEAIYPGIHLVINADDPLLNRLRDEYNGEITTYGVGKTKYDKIPEYAVDFAYCPKCNKKLEYSSYHYGHIGLYKCPNCDFERGNVEYEATDVDLKTGTFSIGKDNLKLNKSVFFAVYYTLVAYTMCSLIGLSKREIINEINNDTMASKRGKSYMLDGRKIEMLESKNENSLSYLQSINYITMQEGKKTVVMGFENVSRRYKYNDLSWLWDVNFELLDDEGIDKIFCIGRFKYDVACRLMYAGIDKEKIVLVEDLSRLLDMVEADSAGDIYTMVCFDMTEIILNMLKEKNHEENN